MIAIIDPLYYLRPRLENAFLAFKKSNKIRLIICFELFRFFKREFLEFLN